MLNGRDESNDFAGKLEKLTTEERNADTMGLDMMTPLEIVTVMNREDEQVPKAIRPHLSEIARAAAWGIEALAGGGRIFYMGAGTSGRLGVVDASEIFPTYGVSGKFIGVIAGGDKAIRTPVENAEDNPDKGWKDILPYAPTAEDTLVGIAASGTTPYVIGAVKQARLSGLLTAAIVCNRGSRLAEEAEIAVEVPVGPEFVTGSTRMKSGTAQKLVLNMISTAVMIRLGHVKGNKMLDMQLTNHKLVDRGTRMIMEETGLDDYDQARKMLLESGSVRSAVEEFAKRSR